MRHALVVLAHPRPDSLTGRVADQAHRRLRGAGLTVDVLDLYAEDFDPRLATEDEPDWDSPARVGSKLVREHTDRLAAADLIVAVFPVWFGGPPAILRGWVERTWSYGFAYPRQRSRMRGKRVRWIGLAGSTRAEFDRYGTGELIRVQLDGEVCRFCGITDTSVRFIHDTQQPRGIEDRVRASARRILDEVLEELALSPASLTVRAGLALPLGPSSVGGSDVR